MSEIGADNLGYTEETKKYKKEDVGGAAKNTSDPDVDDVNTHPIVDVLSADIITKPFSIVAGSAKIPHSKFNPFRKKSGLLNVLAKQSKVIIIITKFEQSTNVYINWHMQ